MKSPISLIATTAFGLEAVVRRELADLGYEGEITEPGWIRFRGEAAAVCRANLWLRSADRILLEVASFAAEDFEALYENTKAVAWHEWVAVDGALPVVGRSVQSQLSSVPACQRAVKKAVVESLRRDYRTELLPETGATFKIQIALYKNRATLTLDTTGAGLNKRGYRPKVSLAPLKETLAAAMVLLSFWNGERPLIDPFCGSGTIPIEAALIGRNLAPGFNRSFTAETWPRFSPRLWHEVREEARDLARADFPERLIGTDVDARALHLARENAERAGVAQQVHFQERAFEQLSSNRKYGCVITNPPYGRRLGDHREWEPLYHCMPEVLRKLPTWSHFILTAYPRFEALLGKQADRRRKLYNGRIECTYYQFHGPKPGLRHEPSDTADTLEGSEPTSRVEGEPSRAASLTKLRRKATSPVFGELSVKADEQADLFGRRLKKRAAHLRRWPTKQGITCFRLYDRDIPEVPLVVDRYEDHLHIAEYERPHDRDRAQHANWLDLMVRTAAEVLGVDRRKVFFKRRRRQRGTTQHEPYSDRRYEITVNEGGLQFLVNLSDYVDTGLFLDHRTTRGMVRELAAGANFLNLFGYTGAFTVYAAAGGAEQTTTVDWSHPYLEWAERNLALNGFEGKSHRLVRADARDYLGQLPPVETFDLAVVDPPTFSNKKGDAKDWAIQFDHAELLNALLARMKPGGVVFFSSNFRRFKLDEAALETSEIREISRQTVPPDFRNRRIHRCWRIARVSS